MAKRIFRILGLLIAIGLGIFLYGGWKMFGDELRAIKTLKMVRERVYTFEYQGDYGFKAFLDQGGAKSDGEMAEHIANFLSKGYIKTNVQNPNGGCSSIAAERLLAQYDVFPSANAAHHLAISDKNDKSIVVEWHRGQMVVTDTDVVTNHCIVQEREHPLTDNSRERFATLAAAQADVTTSEKAHNVLKEVSFEEQTRWSVVYDKTNLMATMCFDCDWDNPLIFNIAEECNIK